MATKAQLLAKIIESTFITWSRRNTNTYVGIRKIITYTNDNSNEELGTITTATETIADTVYVVKSTNDWIITYASNGISISILASDVSMVTEVTQLTRKIDTDYDTAEEVIIETVIDKLINNLL